MPTLHIDIWWIILELLDDRQAFVACQRTCTALRDIGRTIIKQRYSIRCTNKNDMIQLHDRIQQNPAVTLFLRRTHINSPLLTSLATELLGRSHLLKYLKVRESLSNHVLSLRLHDRLALLGFESLKVLVFRRVVFSTYTEFVRIVCSFPGLSHLSLYDILCKRPEVYSLTRIHFAKSLSLKYVGVMTRTVGKSHMTCYRLLILSQTDRIVLQHPLTTGIAHGTPTTTDSRRSCSGEP